MDNNNFWSGFGSALGSVVTDFTDGLITGFSPTPEKQIYHAKWGDINDGFLNGSNKGFRFGDIAITMKTSAMHGLCVGNSGAGKTSAVTICSTLSACGQSFIIHDPSFELYVKTSGFPAHWDPKLRIPRGQVVAAASIVSPKY